MCFTLNRIAKWLPDSPRALTKEEVALMVTDLFCAPYLADDAPPHSSEAVHIKALSAEVRDNIDTIDDLFTLELTVFNVVSKRFLQPRSGPGTKTMTNLPRCIAAAKCMAEQSTIWTDDQKEHYGNTTIDRQIYTALFHHPDLRVFLHFCPLLKRTFLRQLHYIMEIEVHRLKRHQASGNCKQGAGSMCETANFGPFDCNDMHQFTRLLKTKVFASPEEALEFVVNVTPFLTTLCRADQRTAGAMCGIAF